ncbi:MAG: M3 family oligoendopeptidase, partial [Chloroflexota bacterium]
MKGQNKKKSMFSTLPGSSKEFMDWSWDRIEPYYKELSGRRLREGNIALWLSDWSSLRELIYETYNRLYVATTMDTTDPEIHRRYTAFLDDIFPFAQKADQALKEKLLASGLSVRGFEMPLQNMRAEADLFRDVNVNLLSSELKLSNEYDVIIGAQTVEWDGKEVTLPQLAPVYQDSDRERRERAWRLAMQRFLADREPINDLWGRLLEVRSQLAENSGRKNYRDYRWQQLLRFDYTPEDSARFREAIYEVAVPAARRIQEKRRRDLGVELLRPWDLDVDPHQRPPLRPFKTIGELEEKSSAIFHRVDPQLGAYFDTMRREGLLDLENRKGKAPGGYCIDFPAVRKPFIFANSVGIHDDVQTMLHEAGHAFHVFEAGRLPYHQQLLVGAEIAEVASMAMELLSAPYLEATAGGFYTPQDAARAQVEHLVQVVLFWPYMAVVDGFQHWVYENQEQAADPNRCDAEWARLWDRFMPVVDWSGLEQEKATGWHR